MVLSRKYIGLWALLSLGLFAAGCLKSAPPKRLKTTSPIAVAIVHDHGAALGTVPSGLETELRRVFEKRNLLEQRVAQASFQSDFERIRSTRDRFGKVSTLAADASFTLLVEARAQYYSQIYGRYRWNVFVKVSLARAGQSDEPVTSSFSVPVALDFDHQREEAALLQASETVAAKVGKELDAFIAGLDPETVASSPAPASKDGLGPMYFVMVDRFYNGRKDNDGDVDLADPQGFHGGDIKGLIAKLDHIHALGFRTVWLSPVFSMRTEKVGEHGAFHGYWTEDLGKPAERFGTTEELRELRRALADRGMTLVMDVVLNHVGLDTKLAKEKPEWFHHNGDIKDWDDPVQVTTHDVHGLPDLNQENPEVYDFLLSASAHWIEVLQPAGFRLDAVKHASHEFWERYIGELQTISGEEFATVGEIFSGDPRSLAKGFTEGGFGHLFDFPLYYAMRDTFCGGAHLGRLASTLSLDSSYPDASRLVTFADNHDVPRVWTTCGEDEARVRALLTFMFSTRGTPSMNYGTELGMAGGDEPDNRRDMRFPETPRFGALIRTLLSARERHEVLRTGTTRALHVGKETFAYLREGDDATALISVNLGTAAWQPEFALFAGKTGKSPLLQDEVTGAPSVPPMSVDVRIYPKVTLAPPATVTHELEVKADAGGELFVVGASPALGAWAPEKGTAGVRDANGITRFSIALPASEVAVYKIVRKVGETFAWETGGNRYLFSDGSKPTVPAPTVPAPTVLAPTVLTPTFSPGTRP